MTATSVKNCIVFSVSSRITTGCSFILGGLFDIYQEYPYMRNFLGVLALED
jgi:hypothetical protein